MHELRKDPLQRRWVIIASERTRRPQWQRSEPKEQAYCPFCPGNEDATPPPIRELRGEDGWQVRVFPNRFPALRVERDPDRRAVGMFDAMAGLGAHEVIVDTPDHDRSMADLSYAELDRVLGCTRERIADLYRDPRLRYALAFKNHGRAAGATLRHSHTQIIALPITPLTVAVELRSCREHYRAKERCLVCDIVSSELASGDRVVWADTAFLVVAPYASRFPFELAIIPRRHCSSFIEIEAEEQAALARVLGDTLRRLRRCLGDPPFNFVLHTAPNPASAEAGSFGTLDLDYHWRLEVIPRLVNVAGFEWGTGFYLNPTAPELAADHLRRTETG